MLSRGRFPFVLLSLLCFASQQSSKMRTTKFRTFRYVHNKHHSSLERAWRASAFACLVATGIWSPQDALRSPVLSKLP